MRLFIAQRQGCAWGAICGSQITSRDSDMVTAGMSFPSSLSSWCRTQLDQGARHLAGVSVHPLQKVSVQHKIKILELNCRKSLPQGLLWKTKPKQTEKEQDCTAFGWRHIEQFSKLCNRHCFPLACFTSWCHRCILACDTYQGLYALILVTNRRK